jgi:hypothetical protein
MPKSGDGYALKAQVAPPWHKSGVCTPWDSRCLFSAMGMSVPLRSGEMDKSVGNASRVGFGP